MIYHALFIINHVTYALLVETSRAEPHPLALRHATLAAEFTDYRKIRVLKDRGSFFAPQHTGGPYPEKELIKWAQMGGGTLDWQKVINREPLKLPLGIPEI